MQCILLCIRHHGDEEGSDPYHPCVPYLQFQIKKNEHVCFYKNLKTKEPCWPKNIFEHDDFLQECNLALKEFKEDFTVSWKFHLTYDLFEERQKLWNCVYTEEFQKQLKLRINN